MLVVHMMILHVRVAGVRNGAESGAQAVALAVVVAVAATGVQTET
jgi:hypothetical protein